jgi:hypothetical protein
MTFSNVRTIKVVSFTDSYCLFCRALSFFLDLGSDRHRTHNTTLVHTIGSHIHFKEMANGVIYAPLSFRFLSLQPPAFQMYIHSSTPRNVSLMGKVKGGSLGAVDR